MQPSTMNEPTIPSLRTGAERVSSEFSSGEAMIAPPPKPMIARPVAMPGRSGNHLISVETGEM